MSLLVTLVLDLSASEDWRSTISTYLRYKRLSGARRIKTDSPAKASYFIFVLPVVAAVAVIIVAFSPLSINTKLRITGVIFILSVLVLWIKWWRFSLMEWEKLARRRVSALLSTLGTIAVLRGIAGLTLSNSQINAEIEFSGREESDIATTLQTSWLTSSSTEVDVILVILGVVMLFGVRLFLLPSGVRWKIFLQDRNRLSFEGEKDLHSHTSNLPSTYRYLRSVNYDTDLPPLVEYWVGRNSELDLLEEPSISVFAITGIGGQGKSALAAKALEQIRSVNSDEFWDWRDCREEADRFRTQLSLVIDHVTGGKMDIATLGDADIGWLARYFFHELAQRPGIIIFDNVDHYTDLNNSLFIHDVSCFIDEALRVKHKMVIVFTCRPRISYPSTRFREIYLRGLSLQESEQLFEKRIRGGLNEQLIALLPKFHKLTNGHPLWLNIIASQIDRKPELSEKILENLEANVVDERAVAILRSIWSTLRDREKFVLRCMAEIPRPLPSSQIFQYAKSGVGKHNRFDRAFKALRAISLVVEKRAQDPSKSRYELHPLVKAFIRREYADRTERNSLIGRLLEVCDQFILGVGAPDSATFSTIYLELLVTRTELSINKDDLEGAIDTLSGAADGLIRRGLQEELIRLGLIILKVTDWEASLWLETDDFSSLTRTVTKTLVELGRPEEARTWAQANLNSAPDGTANYIGACELAAYVEWFDNNFGEAIKIAKRGVRLKSKSDIDTIHDCQHVLALATRDDGGPAKALEHFKLGQSIESILEDEHSTEGRNAAFYGNVGRCLFLSEKLNEALICYAKSFDLLLKEDNATTILNRGWACFWIGEALEAGGDIEKAYRFYRWADTLWKKRAPVRARQVETRLTQIHDAVEECVRGESDAKHQEQCIDWKDEYLQSIKNGHG